MTVYWIWLQWMLGQGSPFAEAFLRSGLTPKEAYERRERIAQEIEGLPEALCKRMASPASALGRERVEGWRELLRRQRLRAITPDMDSYPPLLRDIYSPPLALYCADDLGVLRETLCVAMVGPRKATPYAMAAARRIAKDLASCGVRVVSGHALGVDSASQEGALLGGGGNVMVLACGHDWDYPYGTMGLRERVREKGGLVLSEYLPGSRPVPQNFPVRNRILSGLSMGVVVVEAGEKSGALITASHALEQGRDIFCVTNSIFNRNAAGISRLLRDGAKPVVGAEDVLMEYLPIYPERIKAPGKIQALRGKEEEGADFSRNPQKAENGGPVRLPSRQKTQKKPALKARGETPASQGGGFPAGDSGQAPRDLSFLDERTRKVWELLENGPLHLDDLAGLLPQQSGALLASLTELEILGLVQSLPGGYYKR